MSIGFIVSTNSWVSEFTVVILGVQVFLDGSGNLDEVGHVDGVANIGVKVILEVLKHVHVFLNVCVSSNSWESEGIIQKFPGVNLELWCNTALGLHGTGNVEGVSPMSWVKSLGEEVNLVVELSLSLIKIDAWWSFDGGLNLGTVGSSNEHSDHREFHVSVLK